MRRRTWCNPSGTPSNPGRSLARAPRHTEADAAVVAQCAITRIDADVVERCRHERRGVVACAAVLDRRQVIDALADADEVVVAGRAAHRVQVRRIVVEDPARKGSRGMAQPAIRARRQVPEEWFSGRADTVA